MDGSIQLFLGVKILGFVLIVTIGKSSNMLICPLKHLHRLLGLGDGDGDQ